MAANLEPVNEALEQAAININRAISLSMDDIGDDWRKERAYINLWVQYAGEVNRYFMSEAARTGNRRLPGNIKKNIIKNSRISSLLPISGLWGD